MKLSQDQIRAATSAFNAEHYFRFLMWRNYIEQVWERVKTPVKFPSPQRRRREDREIPKAA